jgi:hypothetical protein
MKTTHLLPLLFAAGTASALAHAGHHHETGLPDFAAHFFLGLQSLVLIAVPALVVVFVLRAARRKKSRSVHRSHTHS